MQTMKRFTVDLPEELHRRLKLHCVERGINMAAVIRELVEKYLEKAEKKQKK